MRNPRIDPAPGDRFWKGESVTTIVTAKEGNLSFTFCGKISEAPPMVAWDKPWLPSFRKWAKSADVVEAINDRKGKRTAPDCRKDLLRRAGSAR